MIKEVINKYLMMIKMKLKYNQKNRILKIFKIKNKF